MKTSNRNYEQSVVEEQECQDVHRNLWRLTDFDLQIKHWQNMIEHSQTQLKKTIDEKNDLLQKYGLI